MRGGGQKKGKDDMSGDERQTENVRRFARQLRVLRASRDVKQSELAEKLGVDPSTVSNWESGKRQDPPTAGVVKQIEEVLEAPPGFLMSAAGYLVTESPGAQIDAYDPITGQALQFITGDAESGLTEGLTYEDLELLADMAALLRRRRNRQRASREKLAEAILRRRALSES